MTFWRGLRWGFFLGLLGALVGRTLSETDEKQWRQAQVAGDLAAAQSESEQRQKLAQSRAAGDEADEGTNA